MMAKKKIGVVIPTHWSWLLGGAEYQVSLITQQLVADDRLEVTVLSRNVDPAFSPKNYAIKTFRKNRWLSRYNKIFDTRPILSALTDIRPDVIYQRAGSAYTGVCAWYARKHNIPMVWHISHDLDVMPTPIHQKSLLKQWFALLEKQCLEYGIRHATHIIAQTDHQATLLKTHYGRQADQVIRNFHPLPGSDETIHKSEKIKIVWIANFKPMKQPELFVRLARELAPIIDAQFIMIGNVYNQKHYYSLLEDIQSVQSLDYLGELPQEKVNEILSEAHLLVNTSQLEGFSNTFIQAWMREVPVLTLTVDPDDVIKNHEIGICSGSYESLKNAVIELVRAPERRIRMGKQGRQYAENHHSMRNIEQIHETLAQLVLTSGKTMRPELMGSR